MAPDNEGFLQPVIDSTKCVHCGKCEKVCPVLHHGKPRKPLAVYAAKAKDDELRAGSASGGIFTLLALDVLKRGGVVFGAGFDHTNWRVIHKAAHNEEELDDLRGSKYVQSDVGDTYKEAKRLLDEGKEVLYSGCPCQIAALLNFLGKPYPNLTTVDLICHGVPSPLAWRKYIEAREQSAKSKIRRTFFRRYCAWRKYVVSFEFSNDTTYFAEMYDDPFITAFLKEWSVRIGCYNCHFRHLRSGSDLTIGDFWGIEKCMPDFEDTKGTSVIIVNTPNGPTAANRLFDHTISKTITFSDACCDNNKITLLENCTTSPFRSTFFRDLEAIPFDVLTQKMSSCRTIGEKLHHLAWWTKRLLINFEVNKF